MSSQAFPIVEVKSISKFYSKKPVLIDVSLKLQKGEIFGLLGPNGAGKSTLMKILMGIEKADNGNTLFFGKKFDWSIKQKIGIVPQEDFLYKQFTVQENLYFFGLLNNVVGPKLKKRVNFLLKWLNIEYYKNVKIEYLSGGYRKLLNIACSIVHDPEIIFMDEPTVALDPIIRSNIWQKISEMKDQKKTICLTTHYLDEAGALCDRIAILFKGKVLVEDTTENLIERYGSNEIIKFHLEQTTQDTLDQLKSNFPDYSIEINQEEITIIVPRKNSLEALGKISDFLFKKNWKVTSSTIKEPGIDEVFLSLTRAEEK